MAFLAKMRSAATVRRNVRPVEMRSAVTVRRNAFGGDTSAKSVQQKYVRPRPVQRTCVRRRRYDGMRPVEMRTTETVR